MASEQTPFDESGARPYDPDVPVGVARSGAEARLMALPGVRGVGEGRDLIGNPTWIAYVTHKGVAASLPQVIDGRPVLVEVSGEIDAQPL